MMKIDHILNVIEDWIMSRENVNANQEDIINLKQRLENRFKEIERD